MAAGEMRQTGRRSQHSTQPDDTQAQQFLTHGHPARDSTHRQCPHPGSHPTAHCSLQSPLPFRVKSHGGREEQWGPPRPEWETQTTPRRWDTEAPEEEGGVVVPASVLAPSSASPLADRHAATGGKRGLPSSAGADTHMGQLSLPCDPLLNQGPNTG